MKKVSIAIIFFLLTGIILSGCGNTSEQGAVTGMVDSADTVVPTTALTGTSQSQDWNNDSLYAAITTVAPNAQLNLKNDAVEGTQNLTISLVAKGATLQSAFQDYLAQVMGIIQNCQQALMAGAYNKVHLLYSRDSEYTGLSPLTSFDLTLSRSGEEYCLDKISIDRSTSALDDVDAWYLEADEPVESVFKTVYTLLRTEGIYQIAR